MTLKILITMLFVAVVLVIMLLAIPYSYVLKGDIKEKVNGKFQVNGLFRLIRFVCLKTSDKIEMKAYFMVFCIYSNLKKHKEIEKNINKSNKFQVYFNKILNLRSIEVLIEYFKYIISIVKPNSVKINGVYGLEDPFITGTISAVIPIIKSNFTSAKIEVNPVFNKVILDVSIEVKGKVNLLLIGFRTIKLVLNKYLRKIVLKKPRHGYNLKYCGEDIKWKIKLH